MLHKKNGWFKMDKNKISKLLDEIYSYSALLPHQLVQKKVMEIREELKTPNNDFPKSVDLRNKLTINTPR